MGRVTCSEGQIGEEGAIGPDRLCVVDEADRAVDQVLAQVVPLFGLSGRRDRMVVVDELGMELIGLPLEEAVVAVEAALAGPLVVGSGRGGVLHGAEVPLAECEGRVALVAEHLCHGRSAMGHRPAHVREAAVEVRDRAHPDGVVVPAGEQRGAGRRTEGCDVEVGVPEAARGEAVDGRSGEVRPVTPEVGEAGVVEEHEDHVRGARRWVRIRRPPGRRVREGAPDLAAERLLAAHLRVLSGPGCSPTRAGARRADRSTECLRRQ